MRLFQIIFIVLISFQSFADDINNNQSYEFWQSKIAKNPEEALNYFNLGVLYQKNNEMNKAIDNYSKVISLGSKLSPVALYYQARAYEGLNQIDKAKNAISKINLKDVPEKLKQKILVYKNNLFAADFKNSEIDTSQSAPTQNEPTNSSAEKRVSLFFEVSKGTNSNPSSYSDSSSSSISSDQQFQAQAGLDLLIDYSNQYDLKVNYYYSQIRYDQQTGLNYSFQDINLPISFYIDQWRVKLSGEYFSDIFDSSNYAIQKGGLFDISYKAKDQYFNLSLQTNNIKNQTSSYSYLSGYQNKFLIGYESRWADSKTSLKLYSSNYSYVDTSTLGSSYQSYGISLGYTKYFSDLEFAVSTTLENKLFVKASSDTSARVDLKSYTSLQIGYNLASFCRIYVEGDYSLNKSNFNTSSNDKNYKQSLILLGLSLSY
jgi:hypothetical protein